MEAVKELLPKLNIKKDSCINPIFLEQSKLDLKEYVRSDEAERKGFLFNDNTKVIQKIETCKFCGNTLYYCYLRNQVFKNGFKVLSIPFLEKCSCEMSKNYWNRIAIEEQKEKEEKERIEKARLMKMKIEKIFSESGIEERFKQRTFDTFEVNEVNRKAYEITKSYADKFLNEIIPIQQERTNIKKPLREKNCLFVTGSYGTGKTHLACAIANKLILKQIPVICMTMIKLLDVIKSSFDANDDMKEEYILKTYREVPLLIIDDLGSEQITEWSMSKIFSIINSRYEAYMPTIITTNYGTDELIERLTPLKNSDNKNATKTLDRLKEISIGISMNWESYRTKGR